MQVDLNALFQKLKKDEPLNNVCDFLKDFLLYDIIELTPAFFYFQVLC